MKKLFAIFTVILFLSFGSVSSFYGTTEVNTAEGVTASPDPIRPPI